MGDKHPHLLLDPRLARLAEKPYPWPPAGSGTTSNPYKTLLAKVKACEHRGPVARDSGPCNCEVVCLAGKGLPILGTNQTGVNLSFCLACVRQPTDEATNSAERI